jgi:hypothetical protein
MLYFLFVLIFLLCSINTFGQALWETITDMEQENTFCDVGVGRGYIKGEQRKRFDRLKQEATAEELLALTDDSNPVIRCYAFLALADKHHPDVFVILLRHFADKEEVEIVSGCIGEITTVGEVFLAIAEGRFSEEKKPYKLTAEQKKQLAITLTSPVETQETVK